VASDAADRRESERTSAFGGRSVVREDAFGDRHVLDPGVVLGAPEDEALPEQVGSVDDGAEADAGVTRQPPQMRDRTSSANAVGE